MVSWLDHRGRCEQMLGNQTLRCGEGPYRHESANGRRGGKFVNVEKKSKKKRRSEEEKCKKKKEKMFKKSERKVFKNV